MPINSPLSLQGRIRQIATVTMAGSLLTLAGMITVSATQTYQPAISPTSTDAPSLPSAAESVNAPSPNLVTQESPNMDNSSSDTNIQKRSVTNNSSSTTTVTINGTTTEMVGNGTIDKSMTSDDGRSHTSVHMTINNMSENASQPD